VHDVLVGFVLSMVFGHALFIFRAICGAKFSGNASVHWWQRDDVCSIEGLSF